MTSTELKTNWIPDTDSLGARLALVRWRMGWNLAEAERECHLTQNTWGGYEGGRSPRNLIEVINRIVLRTQVSKIWLMTGEGSPEPEERALDYGGVVSALSDHPRYRPADDQLAG